MTTTKKPHEGAETTAGGMPGSDTPARRKPGPGSTCTPELTEEVCVHLRKGTPQPIACEAVGLNWNTARDWNRYGRQGKEPYATVWTPEIKRAKADYIAGRLAKHYELGEKGDAKAIEWELERLGGKRFWRPEWRAKVEHSGPGGGPIPLADVTSKMSDAELRKLALGEENEDE
jgi:hypothetical protein